MNFQSLEEPLLSLQGWLELLKGDLFWGQLFLCLHVPDQPQALSILGCCAVGKLGSLYPNTPQKTVTSCWLTVMNFLLSDLFSFWLCTSYLDQSLTACRVKTRNIKDLCAVLTSKVLLMYFNQSLLEGYRSSHLLAENAYIRKNHLWFKPQPLIRRYWQCRLFSNENLKLFKKGSVIQSHRECLTPLYLNSKRL